MAIIQLEGVDRSGKSTIANLYKKQGYEVVHMSAPDKKYTEPGYTGPSFLDDLIEMYLSFLGKDVVVDRTEYGEAYVWPTIFNRKSLLDEEDIVVLEDLLNTMDVQRFLLSPKDRDAHWKRCVDNKESINRRQFDTAHQVYDRLAKEHNFVKTTMDEMLKQIVVKNNVDKSNDTTDAGTTEESTNIVDLETDTNGNLCITTTDVESNTASVLSAESTDTLQRANAINTILQKKIITKKGDAYEKIDTEIRDFLQKQLDSIFNVSDLDLEFSNEEKQILKVFCNRLQDKQKQTSV